MHGPVMYDVNSNLQDTWISSLLANCAREALMWRQHFNKLPGLRSRCEELHNSG